MSEQKKVWKWTPHFHVAQGRGHRVVSFIPPETEDGELKALVGIQNRGVENLHVIPCKGTIYNNVDVRRRVSLASR